MARQIELRQATWARRAGVSAARLSQAVNGKIVLAPHHVERLRKALRAILFERETAMAKALGQECKSVRVAQPLAGKAEAR